MGVVESGSDAPLTERERVRERPQKEREEMPKTITVTTFDENNEAVETNTEVCFEAAGRALDHKHAIHAFVTCTDAPEVLVDIAGLKGGAMARLGIAEAIELRKELNKAINAARKFA